MRLIDADALKDGLCRECNFYGRKECLEAKGEECDWDSIGHINAAKTIDAVPVVRCRDCLYYQQLGLCGARSERYTNPDGFCHFGVKKEEKT